MKNRLYIHGVLVAIIVIVASCTTKKNTSGTRAYHNTTSRYNILFNGTEAYKKGMLNLQQAYKDDYTKLLPIYLYHDINQISSISSDMDRAIKKAAKLVTMHSLTVKPELDDKKILSEKEREFYSQNEYNKWVDDAYLLLGKAHFFKQEYDKASETFQFILSNFPDNETIYETRVWQARLALIKNRTKEAEDIIENLESDTEFPKKLKSALEGTKAEMAILDEDYKQALIHMKLALESERKRFYKQRFTYIIAQLYQETRQYGSASEYYKKVVKLNPPYQMTFNARINMALTYESGRTSRKDIEKQLQKMLKDDKNIEYQDQIYYAWGNLYFKSGDKNKAIDYYKKSAALGKSNMIQLPITYLTIADIYYDRPEYEPAQAYYDSAVSVIQVNYPNYPIIYAKSISLTNLVVHINTVELEDSVQKLAQMPKGEIYALVDGIIEDVREAEAEAKRIEQQKLLQQNMASQQEFELQTNQGSNWYFYNPNSINLGRQEFRKVWGPRKLEDNWRRKNKSSLSFEDMEADEELSETEEKEGSEPKGSKYSREYYMINIPFTDSALEVSHKKIEESLYEIGSIYYTDLKDYDKAVRAFTDLNKRYPKNEKELLAYYKLYSIGRDTEDKELVSTYKQRIIREYPNSNYAKVLSDPDYFKNIEKENNRYKELYAGAYDLFQRNQFGQVASISRQALQEFPEEELSANFEYLLVVSEGIAKDTTDFIGDLQSYLTKYPDAEPAQNVALLIEYLETANPEAAYEQKTQEAKSLYAYTPGAKHLAVIALSKSANTNQLMFNIINFNIDNYEDSDLKILKDELNDFSLLSITTFDNSKIASDYLKALTSYPDIWRDVDNQGSEIFVISQSNLNLLKKENKLESYIIFFKEQY